VIRAWPLRTGTNQVGVRTSKTEPDINLAGSDTFGVVSRRHCTIEVCAGLLTITDLGSLNGTQVGERKIGPDPVEIQVGQDILIGFLHMQVREG